MRYCHKFILLLLIFPQNQGQLLNSIIAQFHAIKFLEISFVIISTQIINNPTALASLMHSFFISSEIMFKTFSLVPQLPIFDTELNITFSQGNGTESGVYQLSDKYVSIFLFRSIFTNEP
jgi:hypothetical protein